MLFSLFLFAACEEVINVNLTEAEPMNVIDASITENSPCIVLLTRSQGFYNNESYERISDAKVELFDEYGNSDVLAESNKDKGLYFSQMIGTVGFTYTLKVTSGNNVYEAKATIPQAIPIDSVYIYRVKIGNEDIYSPCVAFQDPPEEDNYYYTTLYVNGNPMSSIYLDNDEYRNGLKVENILFFDKEDNNDEELKAGDKLRIDMQTLDKGMYTFYNSLRSVAAGGGTNPLTNITGGALGCFKAYNAYWVDYTVSEEDVSAK
ncbi:DUF4249 domain-containing protein [Dysgonomonas sp. 521]|nr:DUF4249 domain-containing protein [Dysgonomonas sp. 521]